MQDPAAPQSEEGLSPSSPEMCSFEFRSPWQLSFANFTTWKLQPMYTFKHRHGDGFIVKHVFQQLGHA